MDDFATAPDHPNAFGLYGNGVNEVAPGKRPASSMTPLLAVAPDGSVLCVGGSGGPTIVTGVVQTLINVVDFHMTVEAAVSSPRVHAQFLPDTVRIEAEFPADVRTALSHRGHKLLVAPNFIETAVQAVLFSKNDGHTEAAAASAPVTPPAAGGKRSDPRPFSAASDPRKGGVPAIAH
jgi:gamma-glutamyltranspeptidase